MASCSNSSKEDTMSSSTVSEEKIKQVKARIEELMKDIWNDYESALDALRCAKDDRRNYEIVAEIEKDMEVIQMSSEAAEVTVKETAANKVLPKATAKIKENGEVLLTKTYKDLTGIRGITYNIPLK